MSENLDLVRSIFASYGRGDYSSTEWAHSDIEFVIADGPSPGRWTGLMGLEDAYRDLLTAWDDYRVEPVEYRELDDERVLVRLRRSGRGKRSGLELGQMQAEGANLLHVRDGQVTRVVVYFDRDHALADLGLKE